MSNNRPDNQADWLDELLDQFDPINISHHDFERLKPEAYQAIRAKIAEELITELEQLHRTNGKDLPKRDYDNVTDEEICERIDELVTILKEKNG